MALVASVFLPTYSRPKFPGRKPFGKAPEMARKTDGSSSRSSASLTSLRNQVDKIDQQILKLINERARVSVEIGKVKQDASGDVFAPAREEEVIQNLLAHNQGPLEPMTVRAQSARPGQTLFSGASFIMSSASARARARSVWR